MNHTFLPLLLVFTLYACSPGKRAETANAKTTPVDSAKQFTIAGGIPKPERPVLGPSGSNCDPNENDTTYFYLSHGLDIHGTLFNVTLVTERFLDASDIEGSRSLKVFLFHSGDGGLVQVDTMTVYETIYSVLAVFEEGKTGLVLVDDVELEESHSRGMLPSTTEGEEFWLTDEKTAVLARVKSSEEGAGDYVLRREKGYVYLLLENKLASVFETTFENYSFVSDEGTEWHERNRIVKIYTLESKTNGLYDIEEDPTTANRSWSQEEEEREGDEADSSKQSPDEAVGDDSDEIMDDTIRIYKWNGSFYEVSYDQ